MSHNAICLRIRLAIFGGVLCLVGVVVFLYHETRNVLVIDPALHPSLYLWLSFAFLGIIPCIAAAVFAWGISVLVKNDKSFSGKTAQLLGRISTCAFVEAAYILLGNAVIAIVNINYQHTTTLLASLILVIFALAAGMGFAAFARFVQKAADLQEESDLTV